MNPYTHLSLLSFVVFLYLGMYVLRLDWRSQLHQILFFLCASFALWAFSYSFMYSSVTKADLYFWDDVGAPGWITAPALYLGFALTLTGRLSTRLRLVRFHIIYILPVYFLFREWTSQLMVADFTRQPYGWVEVPPTGSIAYYLFIVYFAGCAAAGCLIIAWWGIRSRIRRERRQAALIAGTTLATLALLLITDILLPLLDIRIVPSLGPFWGIALAGAIVIAISRYRFLSITPSLAAMEIITQMKDLLIIIDEEGIIRQVNPQARLLAGRVNGELMGSHICDLFPNCVNVLEELNTGARHPGQSFDAALLGRGGESIPMEISLSPIREHSGDPAGYVMVGFDLRERIRLEKEHSDKTTAEAALRRTESAYHLLAENVSDIIWTMDMNFCLTFCSPSITDFLGYDIDEIMARPLNEYVTPASFQYAADHLSNELINDGQEGINPNRSVTVDMEYVRKDRSTVWASVNVKFIREDGRPAGLMGVTRDISERKAAEKKLLQSEERSRLLVEASPDIIYLLDPQGRFTFISPKFEVISGIPLANIIGSNFLKYLPESTRTGIIANFTDWSNTTDTHLIETTVQMPNGFTMPVELHVVPVRDQVGELIGWLGNARDITERKLTEETLRTRELLYRQITENMADLITKVDTNGIFTYASPSHITIIGYDPAEMMGTQAFDYIHPDDAENLLRDYLGLINEGGSRRREFRFRRADGVYIWIECMGTVLFDDSGSFSGILFSSRDITERRTVEAALRESEKRYRTILDIIGNGYYEVDLTGHMTFCNEYLRSYMRYEPGEMIGMSFRSYMEKGEARKVYEVFRHVFETGETSTGFDWEVIRKDGSHSFVESTVSLIRDLNGEPAGFRGIIRDIMERKTFIEKITASEEKYRQLVDNAGDIIFLFDWRGNVTYINPTVIRLMKYEEPEIIGRNFVDFLAPERRDMTVSFYLRQFQEKIEETYHETPMLAKDGTIIWFGQTVRLVMDNDRVLGFHGIARDITERKIIEDRLRQSEEILRRVTENMWDLLTMVDEKGTVYYASPSHIQLGYRPEDLMGHNPFDLMHPDDIGIVIDLFQRGVETGKPQRGEYRYRASDGAYRWLESSGNVFFDESKNAQYIVISSRDVTERREMELAIQESENSLKARNEIMERDLKNAQIIQRALLPHQVPSFDRLQIDYRYLPLEAVGGDYFSFTRLSEGGMGVFIGDVCGHGVSAALFLSLLKATVDRTCRQYGQFPGEFIASMNLELIDSLGDYFITGIYGHFTIDPRSPGVNFSFAKGGHPEPILYRAAGGTTEFLRSRGTILGKFHHAAFTETTVHLAPGDRVFLYTDGLPEVVNERRAVFGYESLLPILQDLSRSHGLKDTIDMLLSTIARYQGKTPMEDDIMIIGFEVQRDW